MIRDLGGLPTYRALWIPAGIAHTIAMSGPMAMRTLYLKAKLASTLPKACCVINVSPLLRELILGACKCAALKRTAPRQRHLIDLIRDQLETVQMVPLQLRNPDDSRAKRLAQVLLADPGTNDRSSNCAGRRARANGRWSGCFGMKWGRHWESGGSKCG